MHLRSDRETFIRDVIIIGAGPAGLTAACYLGRFRRPTLIIDAAESRARWIPASHNTPGFPQGVAGPELLARLREQALRYGSRIEAGTVERLEKAAGFVVQLGADTFRSRFLILATGVVDRLPPIAGAAEAVTRGHLRICPICDAYEAIDQRLAVLGEGEHAVREAEFLSHYSRHVTVLHTRDTMDSALQRRLVLRGVDMCPLRIEDLSLRDGRWWVTPPQARPLVFDAQYAALQCAPQNTLATDLGAKRDETGPSRSMRIRRPAWRNSTQRGRGEGS